MMGALAEGRVRNVRNPHDEDNLHLHHVFKALAGMMCSRSLFL